jgi:hypothetical protein
MRERERERDEIQFIVTLSPISFISLFPPLRITPILSPSHMQADAERGTKKDRESEEVSITESVRRRGIDFWVHPVSNFKFQ